eukprot:9819273-Ditylum_brightwellii.AAC.1
MDVRCSDVIGDGIRRLLNRAASKMVATASSTSNNYSFAELEFSVNENNGVYQHDKAYDTQKRL